MDNPEKLATQGTQDKEKQNKNTTNANKTWALLQLTGGKEEENQNKNTTKQVPYTTIWTQTTQTTQTSVVIGTDFIGRVVNSTTIRSQPRWPRYCVQVQSLEDQNLTSVMIDDYQNKSLPGEWYRHVWSSSFQRVNNLR